MARTRTSKDKQEQDGQDQGRKRRVWMLQYREGDDGSYRDLAEFKSEDDARNAAAAIRRLLDHQEIANSQFKFSALVKNPNIKEF